MSKLFHDMQNAGRSRPERPPGSEALTGLLDMIGADVATQDTAATALKNCRRMELVPLERPFLLAHDETGSTHAAFEAYRALRTKLVRFQSTGGVRSVVVTSAEAGEGKTVSVVNLGMSLAQLPGQRVLLIDADLRTSGLSAATGALEKPGLAEVLNGEASFESALVLTNIPNLCIVGAGEPSRPAGDLFAGPHFKDFVGWCNETFSMVLVDCPPVIGLSDFEVVSAACDGVLLVIRARRTKRERLADLVPILSEKKLLGLLLNGQERRPHRSRYGYYYTKIGSRAKSKNA